MKAELTRWRNASSLRLDLIGKPKTETYQLAKRNLIERLKRIDTILKEANKKV